MFYDIKLSALSKRELVAFYARINDSYINMEAIFSDVTQNFVTPCEPKSGEPVTIKIRTAKENIENINIVINSVTYKLNKVESTEKFDFYAFKYTGDERILNYYFQFEKHGRHYFFNRQGVSDHVNQDYNYKVIYDFVTPDWAKGAVMYQIYVDRFNNGDKSNDVKTDEYIYLGRGSKRIESWEKPVEQRDVANHYGGDLQGVINKLDYLSKLGVEVIYFNPIFVSPSNHKYDIQDYDYVDPHYGVIVKDALDTLGFDAYDNKHATMYMKRTTNKENLEASNKLFIKLVKLAHARGIRVILDGVFNHCGAWNKWLDREGFYEKNGYPVGAYKSEDSIYNDFFLWHKRNWPNNNSYDSWWGHDNHPKLNYEDSKELESYILEIAKKWVSPPFNADGWRLDVAEDLGRSNEYNHKFWQKFRKVVKEANKDAIIISEHYGDPSEWLKGDEWDSIMNYDSFMEPVTWFFTGMEKHSEEYRGDLLNSYEAFDGAMRYHMSKFSIQSYNTAMNQLSNHDHSRFLTRTNRKVGRLHTAGSELADVDVNLATMMSAVTMQMTWMGSPCVYYGDEAGLTGWTDPDNRRTYPWGKENKTLVDFHREIIRIRKENKALRVGSIEQLHGEYGIIVYARWLRNNCILNAFNNTDAEKEVVISMWRVVKNNYACLETLIQTYDGTYSTEKQEVQIINGYLTIKLKPNSSIVLREIDYCTM